MGLQATHTGDAGDGFGAGLLTQFQDTSGTFNLGVFGFIRDGGDYKGKFVVQNNDGTTGDDWKQNFVVEPDGNATLRLGRWTPQYGPTTVTGGFESGCTVNTWYDITNISNWSAYLGGYGGDWKGIHFAIFWTSGNTAKGYNHQVVGWCPPGSCNTSTQYTYGPSYVTHNSGTTTTSGIPITVHHHTSVTSGHDIRMRTANTGASQAPLKLQIYAETAPNSGDAQITFWRA
jgi:hypothetical protein